MTTTILDLPLLTIDTINAMRVSKSDLFGNLPSGIDYALPQQWLTDFACYAKSNTDNVNYDLIRSTTCYDCRSTFGKPLFRCLEVSECYASYLSDRPQW